MSNYRLLIRGMESVAQWFYSDCDRRVIRDERINRYSLSGLRGFVNVRFVVAHPAIFGAEKGQTLTLKIWRWG